MNLSDKLQETSTLIHTVSQLILAPVYGGFRANSAYQG
ncbi:hypothetical protein A464_2081 [Salmonella bongori N268-08]|uniref:Uncharacterized protein n=1 Tax=Salmonella bongori N268-08 TaxID=1197719 RepID=S5MR99_SALBN|nr:hypothetical protein A464_2081 [Salmonella bongori N268-08]